ncbi:MAG: SWIM zinc finger family protein [Caldilineaceae bacterium]|nr:SWIM zinc finger family protein [Caldilineaceae bacterium]MBP8109090.1 SWIM zinc finger family protein [Caldilineaceae bacterium]MBP8124166.1 SWIM zinc finger family protein [Caldilineaceae bacterium]MBP9073322.1 SWIM zinc finger family protein [Caldilineaceae bacterium]
MSWYYDKPPKRISTDKGIKARNKRGEFAENWWALRWIAALERITDSGRLRRGRTYARQGQVLSIVEKKGAIEAKVQGSRSTPYKISIRMEALTPAQWDAVVDALAERAIFTAQLLAGEMPQEIEEAFAAAKVSLFPDTTAALVTDCSCPDWANPCKHVAAAHYILGEQFDEDPFLLFRLRGRDQEQIFAALRAKRTDAAVTLAESGVDYEVSPFPAAPPLADNLDHFWEMGASLEHFPLTMKEAATPMPILRRLGDPGFLEGNLEAKLAPHYAAASRKALETAFQGQENGEPTDEA